MLYRLLAVAVFASSVMAQQRPALNTSQVLDQVDRKFSRMQDLSADFTQISREPLNQTARASGHLYLMKGGKMRFEYEEPFKRVSVSDSKRFTDLNYANREATTDKVKDTIDERLPIMFLLGRSNLKNEFGKWKGTLDDQTGFVAIQLFPKKKGDVQWVEISVDPRTYLIHRLALKYSDESESEFFFDKIQTNIGLRSSLFDPTVPPGFHVVAIDDSGGR